MVQQVIKLVSNGVNLTGEQAENAAIELMQGSASPAQIGALLIALKMKGETIEEVTGFARAMRSHVVPVHCERTNIIDTCGTGGSEFRVFNVSTGAAFVAAAAGITVAKHGNRAVTGICGSADVLEALGVSVDLTPEQSAECLHEIGMCFLFAQLHHPAMKNVNLPRREIGIRTLFNLLGPLTNPAGAKRQVMGVYAAALCPLAAGALRELGSERAIIVHGEIGLDEIATIGRTYVSELRDGEIFNYELTPHDLGLTDVEPDPIDLRPVATSAENAALLQEILTGSAKSRAAISRRDLIAVNAAATLRISDQAESWPDAVDMAQGIIATGKPFKILEKLAAFTKELKS